MPPPRTRHALVTGGSRGIGLAIAQLLALNSYRCTLLSRSPARLTAALATLNTKHLQHATSIPHKSIAGEISSTDFWSSFEIGATSGLQNADETRIDVLVNCAGITQSSLFLRTSPEAIQSTVDTNLTGMMLGTRKLLRKRYIRRGEDGDDFSPVIINVASLLGIKGGRGAVAYAASKAGVLGFTRALAEDLAPSGIRVNAIVPGYITTDMTTELEASESLKKKIPAGRFGRPEEIAEAALFLAKNQYANNCVVNLDGGLSAT